MNKLPEYPGDPPTTPLERTLPIAPRIDPEAGMMVHPKCRTSAPVDFVVEQHLPGGIVDHNAPDRRPIWDATEALRKLL